MNRFVILSLFILLSFAIPYSPIYAISVSHDVSVSAKVGGDSFFSIYGYSSPNAKVTINSPGIFDETTTDTSGYFIFKDKPASLYHVELCLSAQDEMGRVSAPICVPSIPEENNVTIGPIILPPTVSLNNGALFIGEEPVLSGQTLPDTKVNLSLFTDDKKSNALIAFHGLVGPVEAFTIPRISIMSDSKGNYAVALPSSQSKYYRMFAQSLYQEALSPRSNTLHLGIMPFWMYILYLLGFLWSAFSAHLLDFIIISQIIALGMYFLNKYLHPYRIFRFHRRKKVYPLALRPAHELIIEHISLAFRPNHELIVEHNPLMKV